MTILDALPGLRSLRTFEAAARHLNFSRAAEELGVTTAAVSHHITEIEEKLGVQLLVRDSRKVSVTREGEVVFRAAVKALECLTDTLRGIMQPPNPHHLKVSVTPSFAVKWLTSRLDRFLSLVPEADVHVDISTSPPRFGSGEADVAIYWSLGREPELRVDLLFQGTRDCMFPVCSPKIITDEKPLNEPKDLLRHNLIYSDLSAINLPPPAMPYPDWDDWMAVAGLDARGVTRNLNFNLGLGAIQAAVEGYGVAFAEFVLVADDLAEGRLVRPFALAVDVPEEYRYHVVSHRSQADALLVRTFREWIMAETDLTFKGV